MLIIIKCIKCITVLLVISVGTCSFDPVKKELVWDVSFASLLVLCGSELKVLRKMFLSDKHVLPACRIPRNLNFPLLLSISCKGF